MDCQTCREALSARLDGEAAPASPTTVEEHLRSCAGCRTWQQRAGTLTRTLRVREATPTPDLAPRILAAAPAPRHPQWWWRFALAVVAAAQLWLGSGQIFGLDTGMASGPTSTPMVMPGDMSTHLFDESTAWNIALGLGLAWVALRVRAAAGTLAVLGGFLAILTAYCVHDLATGEVTVARVASHGLLPIGFALVWMVHRRCVPRPDPQPGPPMAAEPTSTGLADPAGTLVDPTGAPATPPPPARGPRRPGRAGPGQGRVIRAGRQRHRPTAAPTTSVLAAAALALVLPLAGCRGDQPAGSHPSAPAASATPLVRTIGQSCTWQHGLTVTVDAVRRIGTTGYTVALHLVNKTVMSYATDGLTVELLVGPGQRTIEATPSAARGAGLSGRVVAPGASTSANYGYALPTTPAGSQVAVQLQPSPVDQPCLLRGTAR